MQITALDNLKVFNLIVSLLILFSWNTALANTLQDVIETKNGAVFKGEIILQDFENKQYKIKLTNGQFVTLLEHDIKKITKNLFESKAQSITATTPTTPSREWTIGALRHTIKHKYNQFYDHTQKEKFKGIRLSHRRMAHSALSLRTDVELASEEHEESLFDTLDKDYLSISGYLTIGKQSYQGLQAYIGAGAFIGHYFISGDDQSNLGVLGTTAIGYRHRHLSALISARYFAGTASDSGNSQNLDDIYSVSLDLAIQL